MWIYNGEMDWHARYIQQAGWTAQLRSFLFKQAGVFSASRVLDLGCGTGAILAELGSQAGVYGLDLDFDMLCHSTRHAPSALLTCADAGSLPYKRAAFEAAFCHFVLLWVPDPLRVVSEMRRVTRVGGAVLALAEPDYAGRIDYPLELAESGRWQAEALHSQGVDMLMGRKLAATFSRAGLRHIETGVIGGQWRGAPTSSQFELEWQTLMSDLGGRVAPEQLQELRALDQHAWQTGERVLYVPTFYAWGVV